MSSLIVAAVDTHHSFRVSLQQATRLEVDDSRGNRNNNNNNNNNNNDDDYDDYDDNKDWSVHTVDYDAFKNKLRQFGKRRSVVRRKLRTSTLGITASELDALLGPPPAAVTRADVQAMMLPTNSFYFLQQLQQQQLQQQQWGQGHQGGSQLFGSHPMGGRIRSDTELRLPHKMMDLSDTQIMSNQRRSGLRRPPVTLLIPEDEDPIQAAEQEQIEQETTTAYVTMSDDVVDDSDDWSKSAHSSIQYIDTAGGAGIAPSTHSQRTMPFIPRLFGTNRPLKRRSIMRQLSNWERNDIVSFLSMELDKAAMFYLSQWQRLSQQYMVLTQGGYNVTATAVDELDNDAISTDDDEIEMNRTFDYVPPNNNNSNKNNINDDDDAAAADGTDDDSAKYEPWIRLGKDILELHAFCVINIVAVRQILIRFDAFARAFEGTPMMQYYMKTIKSDRGATSFRKILQHEEVLALGESYLKQLSMLQQQQQQQQQQQHSSKKNHKNAYSMIAKQFVTEQAKLQAVVASSENAEATSSTGHAPLHDTLLQSLRYYFVLGMLEDRLGFEPSYLHSRGRSLTREMKQLAEWRRHSLEPWPIDGKALAQKTAPFIGCCQLVPFGEVDSEDMHEIKEEPRSHDNQNQDVSSSPIEPVVSRQQRFNLTMALIAGFFYCMNYYIVEPSSTMYVNALGASDAMSATLIGMMPIASFLSAIAYSIWTNSSFRKPFMVSCFLMLTGNIIYSAAFNFRSLPMALAGRFMTGLGGPKCIIRRYLADTTSLNIRTSVNALFGMVVAAGSALGPGCAILLNKLDFSLELPFGSNADIVVNGMTGPGWFMATLWTLFSLLLWFGFREQDRIGLAEQMQKEEGGDEEEDNQPISNDSRHNPPDDDLMTLMSGKSSQSFDNSQYTNMDVEEDSLWKELKRVSTLVTFPVRICLGLLFAKVFVIETLVSCTSSLSKNRYGWKIQQVGLLGLANGMCVIPLSILVGKASMMYQDRFLMICLLTVGVLGMSLLIDYYDLFSNENNGHPMHHSVGPGQYVAGYFITYMSIQSFEGIIGSALSKVIPTALATGTFNSGLLATLTDTFGRSCGDLFISLMGTINIDQLMNLLFLPGVLILFTCLFMVRKYYDLLAV